VSVDTYLRGKDTSSYRRLAHDDLTILVAPELGRLASRIDLGTRRKLTGRRLVALAHHEHTNACRHLH
jgi:hypothetical protein